MVWQDVFTVPGPELDAQQEQERRLAAQAKAGAEWALAALVARYQPPVVRYLTRLTGNPEHSRLLAERLFVRMERRLHGPHGTDHLRLWLLRACTEAGLDALRHPQHVAPPRLHAPAGPVGLLPSHLQPAESLRRRLGLGLDRLNAATGSTRRQVREMIWRQPNPAHEAAEAERVAERVRTATAELPEDEPQHPRDALRHKLVRAVLAELPYGDAQCLALHLVAGLNQTEVAWALGLRTSATQRRIVQGLQLFSRRYEAALASLGLTPEQVAPLSEMETQHLPATRRPVPTPAHSADGVDTVVHPAREPAALVVDESPTVELAPTWHAAPPSEVPPAPLAGAQMLGGTVAGAVGSVFAEAAWPTQRVATLVAEDPVAQTALLPAIEAPIAEVTEVETLAALALSLQHEAVPIVEAAPDVEAAPVVEAAPIVEARVVPVLTPRDTLYQRPCVVPILTPVDEHDVPTHCA